ncbi:MAG: acyl-CoA thioesterase [Planctomycetes bacterium]|nr:acyl-CoA thioesterase [Planctomycetota bacterium]
MSAQVFTTPVSVVFGDMDYARVLYFPTLFHYAHRVMEEWFTAHMPVSYDRFLGELQLGLPTVHAEADYRAPIRYGERIRCEFTVRDVGSTSIQLRFRFLGADGLKAEARTTVVCVAMGAFSKQALPQDLRAALERFREPTKTQDPA